MTPERVLDKAVLEIGILGADVAVAGLAVLLVVIAIMAFKWLQAVII